MGSLPEQDGDFNNKFQELQQNYVNSNEKRSSIGSLNEFKGDEKYYLDNSLKNLLDSPGGTRFIDMTKEEKIRKLSNCDMGMEMIKEEQRESLSTVKPAAININFNHYHNYSKPKPSKKKSKKRREPKQTNYFNFTEEELIEIAVPLSKEQQGCRFLQKKLEEDVEFLRLVFPRLVSRAVELSNDAFGNYLVQKVLELSSLEQLGDFIDSLSDSIREVSLSPHGTRVVQKLISEVKDNPALLTRLTDSLYSIVLDLFKDNNGNHIIQKFVKEVKFPNNQFIYNNLSKNLVEVSTDKHGCCAIQKCIEEASVDQREDLIRRLVEMGRMLILDQFGNYVIQYIIGMRDQKVNDFLAKFFLEDIFNMSKEKFSSNVIEKCFDNCSSKLRMQIIAAIVGDERFPELLFDMYGNYVLQKALSMANDEHYFKLIEGIRPKMHLLSGVSFGNKLFNKLTSQYKELADLKEIMPKKKNKRSKRGRKA